MFESVGFLKASSTNRRARPSGTMVTSECSMMPPNSCAVMWSSLSGYWGKNLYSSNRFLIMQLNTSVSLGTPEPWNFFNSSSTSSMPIWLGGWL